MSERKDLKQLAYSYIKEQIINGDLSAGQDIDEEKLQSQIGVSRTPIREALMRLQNESLVDIYARKGIIISPITMQMIENVYQVREIIEPSIVKIVGYDLDKDILSAFKDEFAKEQHNMTERQLNWYYIESDNRLHSYLISQCKNQMLVKIMNNILDHNQRIRIQSYMAARRYINSNREHVELLEALIQGDLDGAEVLMKEHIISSRRAALNIHNIVK
jgi:DNA-binding GntR family transcriptional regulator